jgi:hypothetical protein
MRVLDVPEDLQYLPNPNSPMPNPIKMTMKNQTLNCMMASICEQDIALQSMKSTAQMQGTLAAFSDCKQRDRSGIQTVRPFHWTALLSCVD